MTQIIISVVVAGVSSIIAIWLYILIAVLPKF